MTFYKCENCKDTGQISIRVTTDYDSGASHRELVSCERCEAGKKRLEEDGI